MLSAREADFVVGAMEPIPELFDYHPVFSYDLVLITPEDHPLAGREFVEIQEATEYPAVVPPAGTYNQQFGESIAHQFAREARVAVETSGWGVIKQYVQDGFRGLGGSDPLPHREGPRAGHPVRGARPEPKLWNLYLSKHSRIAARPPTHPNHRPGFSRSLRLHAVGLMPR